MIIKSYTHEIASRQELEMVKITDQVQKDVAASGITARSCFCHIHAHDYGDYDK